MGTGPPALPPSPPGIGVSPSGSNLTVAFNPGSAHQLMALDPCHPCCVVKGGGGITGRGIGTSSGNPHARSTEFIDVQAAGGAETGNH